MTIQIPLTDRKLGTTLNKLEILQYCLVTLMHNHLDSSNGPHKHYGQYHIKTQINDMV